LTIANSGVTSLTTSSGLSINTSAVGAVSITNTGVTGLTAGAGISVNQSTGPISISNTGVLSVTTFGGSGITINNPSPGVFEFVNSLPNVQQDTFRSILVAGQATVQADNAADNLILLNGTGINITTDAATDAITFTNTGVTTLAGSGAGISVSAATGSVNISNTGVTSLVAGSGISVSTGTGAVTVTNTRFGFQNFAVASNPNPIQADNDSDTFTFVAGEGVVLIPNPTNDSLEINVSFINGNVFAHDSTLLIDAAGSQILGDINTARLRTSETQIALGFRAGETSQGANSIAIGNSAGFLNQSANSIIINASGSVLNGSAAGFYVEPIREDAGPQVLYYDPTGTKEITWGPVPAGGGGGGGGGDFDLRVAADDSTLRKINSGESIKFIGTNGVTTTSDAEGNITISAAGVSASNSFATIAVAGQSNVVADSAADTLTLVAGSNVTITTNAGSDTITISAAGGAGATTLDDLTDVVITSPLLNQVLKYDGSQWVNGTDATGGGGVSSGQANRLAYYASTGTVVQDTGTNLTWNGSILNVTGTIAASGAVSYVRAYFDTLAELTAISPSTWHGMVAHVHDTGRMYFAHAGAWEPLANFTDLNIFTTIAVAGQSNVEADSSSDTLTLVAGTGISITTNDSTDTITITNASPNVSQNVFSTIAVAGQSNVVADSSSDTLTLVAGSNITITTNASTDTITINSAGVSGLASRTSPSGSTGNIADAATANVTVTGFKGYLLYKIQTSAAAWVRVYTSVAARSADSGRSEGVDPSPGAGVIAEVITTGAQTILITPGTIGFNDESPVDTNIQLAVTNKSGGPANITVTLTVVKIEE